jgi:hypothetical protein
MSFLQRIGLPLVAPRTAAQSIGVGEGARDVAWLLVARVVAGETPRIARAIARGTEGSLQSMLIGLVGAAGAVLPDVLGILIAAILLSFLGGRKKPSAERGRVSDRTLDVAAMSWIPYLAVELAGALLFTALGRTMRPVEELLVDGAAVGWATVVWLIGLVTLRRES